MSDLSPSFHLAIRQLASGVCLITHGRDGAHIGMTATSVVSLSTEPPTLIVCVKKSASLYPGLKCGDVFGVSVLGAQHTEHAEAFASGAGRFAPEHWRETPAGVPVLADALAALECEAEEVIERHSFALLVGRVTEAAARPGDGALLCWRGGYDRIGWSAEEISRAIGTAPRDARAKLRAVP